MGGPDFYLGQSMLGQGVNSECYLRIWLSRHLGAKCTIKYNLLKMGYGATHKFWLAFATNFFTLYPKD
jgi:hypothetical protein